MNRTWALQTPTTTYAVACDERGLLRSVHWGGRIDAVDDLTPGQLWDLSTNDLYADIAEEEFPLHGGFRYKEVGLRAVLADGTRELRPVVADGTWHERGHLTIRCIDEAAGLTVDLHYRTVGDLDLIERWVVVSNTSQDPILLERIASAQFHIPFDDLRFSNVSGLWAAEFQPFTQPTGPAKLRLDSRKGVSDHRHNPSFILAGPDTTETAGPVWFGALAHPGNFFLTVEQSQYGGTSVTIGIGEDDCAVTLEPGGSFTTPPVVAGYTRQGYGRMSTTAHEYGRRLMRPGPRPVLYNSWEAAGFDVTDDGQRELATRARAIGAELFVVDDGWFGRRGQEADGLGDWWVSPEKFPRGLAPLVAHVNRLGMAFGIWVEPEMVSPNSDLYAAHPDWVHRDARHDPETSRDQLVLDLSRPDVRDHIFSVLDGLLSENAIAYLKWDANRPMAQVGPDRAVWWEHTAGLVDVVQRLREAHPEVLIEACASGGGRVDLGTLGLFDDFWPSDNTDALDRLTIQRGYSMLHPTKAMRAWITDSPNFLTQRDIPLRFRAHVAMMGSLGVGADLSSMTETELAELGVYIDQYKTWRPVIQEGALHRLDNPSPNAYQLYQFSVPERSLVFVFLPASRIGRRGTRVRLRGLEPDSRYRFTANWVEHDRSGAWLMEHGFDVWLQGDYASDVIVVDRIS